MGLRAARRAWMTTSWHVDLQILELGLSAETCLGQFVVRGPTMLGRGGGAITRRTTLPFSYSRTILAHRSLCRAALSSISSPMVFTQRWRAQPKPRMAGTSGWVAELPRLGST